MVSHSPWDVGLKVRIEAINRADFRMVARDNVYAPESVVLASLVMVYSNFYFPTRNGLRKVFWTIYRLLFQINFVNQYISQHRSKGKWLPGIRWLLFKTLWLKSLTTRKVQTKSLKDVCQVSFELLWKWKKSFGLAIK